jgi:hypothetical protein
MLEKSSSAIPVLLTAKKAAEKLHCSVSFLAKKRMSGDGPAFIKRGRSVLYAEPVLVHWLKSQTRTSTSLVCALFALVKATSYLHVVRDVALVMAKHSSIAIHQYTSAGMK